MDRLNAVRLLSLDAHGRVLDWMSWQDAACLYARDAVAWTLGDPCLTVHGGYGLAVEYDVERKFRETRLYTVAPINNNLVLAYIGQHVLGMPRSY